jgi:hypothetical protein
MIANAKKMRQSAAAARVSLFLGLLPQIREQARFAFRAEEKERRQELITEVIANCWAAFVRLVERGLVDVIYPSPLARFAIKQVREGRRVGAKLSVRDVSSEYAQRRKRITVGRLDRYDDANGCWREVLIEDRKAGPAETAAARIDISVWLDTLPKHKRRIVRTLMTGESTSLTAKKFGVTPGRISQMRRELQAAWADFQGEPADA